MVEGSVTGKAAATTLPRHTNSGVVLSLGVDWATWSRPRSIKDFRDVLNDVFRRFFSQGEKVIGGRGYVGVDAACYGKLLWRGSDILVDLPGRAMDVCRNYLKISDEKLCEWFLERGFRATRLDCALDTSDKALNPRKALEWWRKGLVRCGAHTWEYRHGELKQDEKLLPADGTGMTTYVGSSKGIRRARIYDKKTEALHKTGEIVTDQFGNELDHLTRIELQHRKEAADAAAMKIATKGIRVIRQLIAGYVTFLSPDDKRNKRRKVAARWWLRIVGDEREFLSLTRSSATPDDSIAWIERQALQTLRLIREKAPDVWQRLLNEKLDDCEVRAFKQKLWSVWAKTRAARQAELKEMQQSEMDDEVIAMFLKESSATGRTVGDHE